MRPQPRADPEMLAIIAVVLFVIAFILNAAGNQRQRDFLAVQPDADRPRLPRAAAGRCRCRLEGAAIAP